LGNERQLGGMRVNLEGIMKRVAQERNQIGCGGLFVGADDSLINDFDLAFFSSVCTTDVALIILLE
jgi:hypothetical protein